MSTEHDKHNDEYLELNIELASKTHETTELRSTITAIVLESLLEKNGEYKNNYHAMGERVIPHIVFWPYEDPK